MSAPALSGQIFQSLYLSYILNQLQSAYSLKSFGLGRKLEEVNNCFFTALSCISRPSEGLVKVEKDS